MKPELSFLGLSVPSYFLVLSIVFSFIVLALVKRAKSLQIHPSKALDLYLYVLFGSFFGARAFYILYQDLSYFIKYPSEVFAFWKGGFVFYGGFIGGTIAILLFSKLRKEGLVLWLNFSAPLLALGYGLGRFACLLNGCCYGIETDVWWAVYMHDMFRHPTQVYVSVWELLLFAFLILLEKKQGFNTWPYVFSLWLIGHGLGRVVMESFRGDDRGELLFGTSVSTVISLCLILCGALSLLYSRLRTKG